MNWRDLFLTPRGRIDRPTFWIGAAALVAAGLIADLIPIVGDLILLALLFPWTCVISKRLHDFGQSGWLAAVPAIPAAASGVLTLFAGIAAADLATLSLAFAVGGAVVLAATLAGLVSIAFLLWVGLKPGDGAFNRYGEASAFRSLAA